LKASEDLRRELGFWTALTIGAGTMIGAGIFLLAGVAVELTGPGAIFAYLLAVTVFLLDILYAILDPRVRVGPE
jgi:L-asparagine transporter-like permease